MRMIAVSENERCPFLLEEPYWTDDTQVSCFVRFLFTQLDTFTRLLSSICIEPWTRTKRQSLTDRCF